MSGLIGAIAGFGEGLQKAGSALFADAIEKKRMERLEAIEDRRYARARADQLADQASDRKYQTSERLAAESAQRTLQSDRLTSQEKQLGKRLDFELDLFDKEGKRIGSTLQADDGSVIGITKGGEVVDLGSIATIDPLLTPSLRAYEAATAEAARLGIQSREDNPAVYDRLQRAASQFYTAYDSSLVRMGEQPLGAIDPDSGLPISQIVEQGETLFQTPGPDGIELDDGTFLRGPALQEARRRYQENFRSIYETRIRPNMF